MDKNSTVNSCGLFNGNSTKCEAVLWTTRILALLSLLACLSVIILIVLFKKYKIFSQKLTLYLAFACLIQSISQISNKNYESGPTCTFMGWLLQFSDGAVLIWICAISLTILRFVIRKDQQTDHREWLYHMCGWGLPFLVSLLPFISSKYGPAGMWCWVVNDWKWRMSVMYIPAYALTGAMFIIYGFSQYKIFRLEKEWYGLNSSTVSNIEQKQKLLRDEVRPVISYPGAYILLFVIPLVHRIYNAVHPDKVDPFALVLIHSICLSLRGLVNGIIFITRNRDTLRSLKPSQLHVAFLNWRQKDEGLIREYDTSSSTQRVHCVSVPSVHQAETPASTPITPQSVELEELDKQFHEMTKNIQDFGVELQSVGKV